jgi:hypothetical protein
MDERVPPGSLLFKFLRAHVSWGHRDRRAHDTETGTRGDTETGGHTGARHLLLGLPLLPHVLDGWNVDGDQVHDKRVGAERGHVEHRKWTRAQAASDHFSPPRGRRLRATRVERESVCVRVCVRVCACRAINLELKETERRTRAVGWKGGTRVEKWNTGGRVEGWKGGRVEGCAHGTSRWECAHEIAHVSKETASTSKETASTRRGTVVLEQGKHSSV